MKFSELKKNKYVILLKSELYSKFDLSEDCLAEITSNITNIDIIIATSLDLSKMKKINDPFEYVEILSGKNIRRIYPILNFENKDLNFDVNKTSIVMVEFANDKYYTSVIMAYVPCMNYIE